MSFTGRQKTTDSFNTVVQESHSVRCRVVATGVRILVATTSGTIKVAIAMSKATSKQTCNRCKAAINKGDSIFRGAFGYSHLCIKCKNGLDPNMKGIRAVIKEQTEGVQ